MTGSLPLAPAWTSTHDLVYRLGVFVRRHTDLDSGVVVLGVNLSNTADITEVYGSAGVQRVLETLAKRAVSTYLPVEVLQSSPTGGLLLAVAVDNQLHRTQVSMVTGRMRGLVDCGGVEVWPVLSSGGHLCAPGTPMETALREANATAAQAAQVPGTTSLHRSGPAYTVQQRLEFVRELAGAITSRPDELTLAYQPVRDLRSNAIIGAEALLRWQHPHFHSVSPLHVIQTAENHGLMLGLGQRVLENAIVQAGIFTEGLRHHFRMHVNVSPMELREPTYVDRLQALLEIAHLPADHLTLEITERALLSEDPTVQESIRELTEMGVGLALDDFGTGYASIHHLRTLPFETVKVDRSVIAGVAHSGADFRVARSVFGLIDAIGLTAVAEGIEDAATAQHLQTMGYRFAQGYHLGRPMEADAFATELKRNGSHLRSA